MGTGVRSTPESFWASGVRVDAGYETKCLVGHWKPLKGGDGYVVITYQGKQWLAHRLAWLLTHGSLPPHPIQLDHLCNNPPCYEPTHLDPKTPQANVARARNAQREKTHCKRNHEFTEENTRITPAGKRRCRTCHREGGNGSRSKKG